MGAGGAFGVGQEPSGFALVHLDATSAPAPSTWSRSSRSPARRAPTASRCRRRSRSRARQAARSRGLRRAVDYPARVEVLTPRSLDEALALKAERPDAVPIQGGTDVMVELNFDRARPRDDPQPQRGPELRGWSRENGSLRLGAGLTYAEAMEGELAELQPALAEASRTVGSPQIRNRGTVGGNLGTTSPAGGRALPLLVEDAGRACEDRLHANRPARGVPRRAQEERARRGRADRRGHTQSVKDPADLHEGRAAERHGDRGVLAALAVDREREEIRAAFGSAARCRRSSPRRSVTGPSSRIDSRRRRARSTTSAGVPPTGDTRLCRRPARWNGY